MGAKLWKGAVGIALLLAIWQLAAVHYDSVLFPTPVQVLRSWWELLAGGTLGAHIATSLARFVVGYITAALCGIVAGLLFGWFAGAWLFVDPVIQLLRPVSPLAWTPFIVLWFGIGDIPAVVIIFISVFYPVLLATVAAVGRVEKIYLRVAQNFAFTRFQTLTKIVLPASFPQISTGLHQGIGTGWVFLVAGEMVGAQSGLGYLIIDSRNNLRPDWLLVAILTIGALGLLLDTAVNRGEKQIYKKWGGAKR
ncbi:MAG: ABC transporter permease [Rikenellaceae bacterium]|jgi:NitT/TauT family transport system permease protein|nr:ABC transporter permease [Rikenellaceae bacterium]